jgi:hypothetical protein
VLECDTTALKRLHSELYLPFTFNCGTKNRMNVNTCTTIKCLTVIEFVTSRNSSKYVRKFHQEIVVTSGISYIFIKGVEIQSLASNAEGRLRSHVHPREMWGARRSTGASFLPSDFVDSPPSRSFHHSNIITFQSPNHRRFINLANEVVIKKFNP